MKFRFTIGEGEAPSMSRVPVRIVVVADFIGAGAGASAKSAPPERFVIEEAGGFDAALGRFSPELFFEVDSTLSGATLALHHEIASLRDLAPRALVRASAELERGLALLHSLEAIRVGGARRYGELAALADAHRDLAPVAALLAPCRALALSGPSAQSPAPGAPAAGAETSGAAADALGRIMQMVELPGRHERAAAAIDSLVSSVASSNKRPHLSSRGAEEPLSDVISNLSALWTRQLDAVMHHRQLLAVEGLWRGLRRLVRAVAFRGESARVELVQLQKRDLLTQFEPRVVAPERASSLPPTVILAPYAFDSPDDAALMQHLAEQGEALQTPVVSSVSPAFFGTDADGAPSLPYPEGLLESSAYDKHRSLRGKSCARWLALTFNRTLARPRYERESSRVAYEEARRDDGAVQLPLCDASFAVGERIAASVARYGWPTEISGREHGRLDDLPLREVRAPSGRRVNTPLESHIESDLARDLADCGFICLEAAADSDSAFVRRAPTLSKTAREQARRGDALPYQMLASRLAHAVAWFRAERAGASSDVARDLERFLAALISDSGAGAFVEVKQDGARVAVDLRTGRAVLGGASLGFSLEL